MSIHRRIANLFSRSWMDREIDAELQSHIAMRIEDNLAAGMSPERARREALLKFGNPAVLREQTTAADAALYLESICADIRFAFRQLRQAPTFALTSILILALGIGAATAIFSVVKPILVDPLPYPHASRLMMLWETRSDGAPLRPSYGTFHGLSERARAFEALAVMKPWQPALASTARPQRLEGQRVSAGYFGVLGVAPHLGHDFQPADDRIHGPNVVLLSDRLWRRSFAADPAIVGKQVRLDDDLYTVAGVMPPSFENVLAPTAELWSLLQYDPALPPDGREWGHHLRMVGLLRAGVGKEQARAELNGSLRALAATYARGYASSGGAPTGMLVNPLQGDLAKSVRPALLAVLGAVALVLLIAGVNVSSLLLARGAQRRAEFSMRVALGANNRRLLRQLLTESLILAALGGGLGLAIAFAGVRALVALSPPALPRMSAVAVDGGVFLFAFAMTAVLGVVVGLVPALQALRSDLRACLQQSSTRIARSQHWTRRSLVIAEVAIAAVLLVGAGLLLRSMQHLFAVDIGFDAGHLLTLQVQEASHRYDSDAAALRFFSAALERVRAVPGVILAGFTSQLPLSGDADAYGIQFEKDDSPAGEAAFRYTVAPGYLETMRIPLLRGRLLDERDIAGAPTAVLIDESLALRKFPGENPLGRRVRIGPDVGHADRPWAVIVGVVGEVKQESLAAGAENAFYVATAQWSWTDSAQTFVIRTHGDPTALSAAIRDAIWSVDKDQPIVRVAAMENLLAASEAERHFVLILFEAFALVGILLAAAGLYGVLSGSVAERTREIGVRAALGASRGSILAMIVRQGMLLTILGVIIGFAASLAAGRILAALLFGISPLDLPTYLGVAAILLAVSALACFVPARRAAAVDPVTALRSE